MAAASEYIKKPDYLPKEEMISNLINSEFYSLEGWCELEETIKSIGDDERSLITINKISYDIDNNFNIFEPDKYSKLGELKYDEKDNLIKIISLESLTTKPKKILTIKKEGVKGQLLCQKLNEFNEILKSFYENPHKCESEDEFIELTRFIYDMFDEIGIIYTWNGKLFEIMTKDKWSIQDYLSFLINGGIEKHNQMLEYLNNVKFKILKPEKTFISNLGKREKYIFTLIIIDDIVVNDIKLNYSKLKIGDKRPYDGLYQFSESIRCYFNGIFEEICSDNLKSIFKKETNLILINQINDYIFENKLHRISDYLLEKIQTYKGELYFKILEEDGEYIIENYHQITMYESDYGDVCIFNRLNGKIKKLEEQNEKLYEILESIISNGVFPPKTISLMESFHIIKKP